MLRATLGGLLLGSTTAIDGVRWSLTPGRGITGWGSPASTASPTQKPRGPGVWVGEAFLAARYPGLSGTMSAATPEAAVAARDALISAASIAGTDMVVHETGRDQRCVVRRQGEVTWDWVTETFVIWSVSLIAPDPRRFGSEVTASTALPSTTGGLTVPLTVPFTIPAVTVTGQIALTNPGTINGPVTLRITGPVTGPIVTHVASGRSLVFSSSITLGAGEWLDVDAEAMSVLANGQSSRNGWVTSRGWPLFEPGQNVYAFTAVSYSSGALLTVTGTPAWE